MYLVTLAGPTPRCNERDPGGGGNTYGGGGGNRTGAGGPGGAAGHSQAGTCPAHPPGHGNGGAHESHLLSYF